MKKLRFILLAAVLNIFAQVCFSQNVTEQKIFRLGIINHRAESLPLPKMPKRLKNKRINEKVSVKVLINSKGNVKSAKALTANSPRRSKKEKAILKVLRSRAEKAALKAKFKPLIRSSLPYKVQGFIFYNFPSSGQEKLEKLLKEKRIRSGVINGVGSPLVKPIYPEKAKENCIGGVVEVETVVHNWTGEVVSVKAISGNPLLFESAENAVLKSWFRPTMHGNRDFFRSGVVIYNFRLKEKCLNKIENRHIQVFTKFKL